MAQVASSTGPASRPTVLILNPNAGSVRDDDGCARLVREVAERQGWQLVETSGSGEATEAARRAARGGAEAVLACGGDGTVSAVLGGLAGQGQATALGVVPAGTGNDFARTLGMPLTVPDALAWLEGDGVAVRAVDLLRVRARDREAFAMNCLNGGLAQLVGEALEDDVKARWGVLAYVKAASTTLDDLEPWTVEYRLDDAEIWDAATVVSFVVANARCVGGGLEIAPAAEIEDGLLDVMMVHAEGVAAVAGVALRARSGTLMSSPNVEHRLARRVHLRVPEDFAFSMDGEPFAAEELVVEVCPGALPVLVGPDYVAEVAV